jgi:hypothetical protein
VLLDTFVVRPLLVPAFTLLVWRWKHGTKLTAVPLVSRRVPRKVA